VSEQEIPGPLPQPPREVRRGPNGEIAVQLTLIDFGLSWVEIATLGEQFAVWVWDDEVVADWTVMT
jgi:hypothetical protein